MINQGDEYFLTIKILNETEEVDIESIEKVEFAIGNIIKTYPEEVRYYENTFHLPLTQQETFALGRSINYQIRIKWKDGTVTSSRIKLEKTYESISKNIL